jgi:mediator of RNA polymerase II transcription subunit 21
MSNSIGYLTSRSNFLQVSPEIPITKQRNPEKYDPPEIFEGGYVFFDDVYN